MSPAIVTYHNVPARAVPAEQDNASEENDGNASLEIIIPGFRSLSLTGHLTTPHSQGLVKDTLGAPYPDDPDPRRPGEEEEAANGSRQRSSTITSADVQGTVAKGQRGVKQTARTAVRKAARQAAREEQLTNPAAVQARRSDRLARKAAVDYNPDTYYKAVRGLFR